MPARNTPLDRLIGLVERLRSPRGCPWDRKQTHRSLIKYLREEAAELAQALRKGNGDDVEDELGDVLLQVLLHAQIASERGRFDIQDVARSQYLKLKRRHPHVFGGRRFRTAQEVLRNWDAIKVKERALRRKDLERRRRRRRAAALIVPAALLASVSWAMAARRLAPRMTVLGADGSFAAPLPGLGSGFDAPVTALAALADGKILALGEFTSFDGHAGLNGLVRLEPDGSLDERFSSLAGKPLSQNGRYDAAAVQPDGKILLGGYFTTYGGHKANGILRLHPEGGMDMAFLRGTDFLTVADTGVRVRSISVGRSGRVLLGGDFAYRPSILRLRPNGVPDVNFHAPPELRQFEGSRNDDDVKVELQPDGKLLLAGSFHEGRAETVGRLVRLHPDGGLDASFSQASFKGNDRSIKALLLEPDGSIWVAGSFNEVDGIPVPNLVRLRRDGVPDQRFLDSLGEGFGKEARSVVRALLDDSGGAAIAAGEFGVGRVLADGRVDEEFSKKTASRLDGPVYALARLRGGKILAAGAFSSVADPKTAYPAWNKCSSGAQCRAVAGLCGEWDLAAQAYADEVELYNAKMRPATDCVYQENSKPEPACVSGVCSPRP